MTSDNPVMPLSDEPAGDPRIPRSDRPAPLTRRERRRRVVLLAIMLLALLLLSLFAYYWLNNRSVPVPRLGSRDMVAAPEYVFSITGSGKNQLIRPVGVDVGADGRVYVVDFGRRRISVFTSTGEFLFAFNEIAGDEVLGSPVHLQVEGDEVWVTDRRRKSLFVFDLEGKFKRRFEVNNEPKFEWTPLAIGFDDKGLLYATDVGTLGRHRVIYFSEEGSRTVTVGKKHTVSSSQGAPGTFYFPNGIAVAKDGTVFVADSNNRRVQVLDEKGKFQRFVDTSGIPRGIVIDAEQRLYIVDALAHMVDVYDVRGRKLTGFGSRGFGPGQFNYPNDVALDGRGRIYVSDRENNQVQVWQWPAVIIPEQIVPTTPWQWLLCLLPLLPLLLLPFLRRKTYVVTVDFLEHLVAIGHTDVLTAKSRIRLVAPEVERTDYEAIDGLERDILELLIFEEHSESDVAAIAQKLKCSQQQAIYVTMAERARALLSEDVELRRLAIMEGARCLDTAEFMNEVGYVASENQG